MRVEGVGMEHDNRVPGVGRTVSDPGGKRAGVSGGVGGPTGDGLQVGQHVGEILDDGHPIEGGQSVAESDADDFGLVGRFGGGQFKRHHGQRFDGRRLVVGLDRDHSAGLKVDGEQQRAGQTVGLGRGPAVGSEGEVEGGGGADRGQQRQGAIRPVGHTSGFLEVGPMQAPTRAVRKLGEWRRCDRAG